MLSETLRYRFVLDPALTESAWKKKASETLQIFGRCKNEADTYAEDLYQTYVVEHGFTDYNYRDDPYCAVLDDHDYAASVAKPKTVTLIA
jgi:hypothetical protein